MNRDTFNKAVLKAWESGDVILLAILAYYAPKEGK